MRTKEESKAVHRTRSRVYRQLNPEKIKATNRTYYLANREKLKAQTAAYRKAHPMERKVSRTVYDQAHREEHKAYCRAYYRVHQEALKAYQQGYREAHKKELKAYRKAHSQQYHTRSQRRRALQRGVEHQPYKAAEIALRDQGICGLCHKRVAKADRSIDHILPLSLGGADAPYNVQLAHLRCNSMKQNSARFPTNLRLALT